MAELDVPQDKAVQVRVRDERRLRVQGLALDLGALAALLVSSVALGVDVFFLGRISMVESLRNLQLSDGSVAQVVAELAVFVASFAWIAGRLVRASVRENRQR